MSDDPANPLLDHLTEDARSFSTIARSWAKGAQDSPEVMMNLLVSSFWRGEFECDGKSSVFALLQPDSPHFFDRRPGNYATRADGIVKVGADLRSYVTAERKKVQIFRRVVAEVLCWKEWDGTDDGLLGLSTIPFEKWSEDIQELHYSQWRMRRDDFAKWYPSTALTAEAQVGKFWPDLDARRSVPPKLVDSRHWDCAMLERKWLTLPAGLMWATTRDANLTQKVQTDSRAFENIALSLATRLAAEEVYAHKPLTYFDSANAAWLALRDVIADEKVRAEGQLIERRGLQKAIELSHTNGPIPSGEAGWLILLDNWGGHTETVLGPDEAYRFHSSQGRYWKRVRLLARDLYRAFPKIEKLGLAAAGSPLAPISLPSDQALLAHLMWDYRTFVAIGHTWSKVAGEPPETMLGALMAAFFVGEFERDGGSSSAVFSLEKPDGNYASSQDVIFKVSKDGERYVSRDREELQWCRSAVADILANLGGFRWNFSGQGPDAFSTIPITAYPEHFLEAYLPLFCVRRHDFKAWYSKWPLSAVVPLERFWSVHNAPPMDTLATDVVSVEQSDAVNKVLRGRQPVAKKRTRGRKPNPLWPQCKREALVVLEEKGPPSPDDEDKEWRCQSHLERWIHDWWVKHLPTDGKPPVPSTVRTYASHWLRELSNKRGND